MWNFKLFSFIISSIFLCSHGSGYDGDKFFEIIPETRDQCDLLFELSKNEMLYDFVALSKLPNTPARVIVKPDGIDNFLDYLKMNKIEDVKILNENIGESIELELNETRLLRTLKPIGDRGRLATDRYYTHDEVNEYIENVAERYPKRAYVKVVGKSFEGRSLKTLSITNGDGVKNKKIIFLDGGIHARESMSISTALYVIEQLVENYEDNADLLLDHEWIILPVVNPDGYEYTQTSSEARVWRKTRQPHGDSNSTCFGADANRNFDFHWNLASPLCSDTYEGPNPFSEPETVILRDLIQSMSDRGVMYLTLHSFGNYLLYPWGWTKDLPDTWEDLDEVARVGANAILNATGTIYTIGSSANVFYIACGAADYAFQAGFPIAFTMELPAGGSTGFHPPVEEIDGLVKESWIGISAMARKVIQKY